ncbi:helix-turn-helix domain-containing protein [Bradyrhizobium sp. SRS-191]|uniref:helix-turn-helix domain-containing protein n=1 Tax=Bradyrhizobium sp. SRS-191 TaxID=2962606 RepID=UPI00211EE36E|nr:helix-turn-helix domain-containing protein [Bradyrhizobium sp. SRS-191]
MTNTDTSAEPLRQSRVRAKWDFVTDPGFLTLPYVLLLHQSDLKISSEHLNVLLNFIAHWHSNGRMPHPRTSTIASRMGISPRSVQRAVSWLIENGFLAKAPRLHRNDVQQYDMAPLVEKLKPYAWARIKYIQEKDFERVLDDNIQIAMRRTAKDMFGEAVKKLADEL